MKRSMPVIVALVMVLGTLGPAQATILTFDNLGLPTFGDIPGAYGDNVNALCDAVGCYGMGTGFTPNITVDYRTRRISDGVVTHNNLDFWTTAYGDLVNVAFPVLSTGHYGEVTLTPAPGWAVVLNSFHLAGWPTTNYANQPVQVLDASNTVLFDASGTVLGAGPSHSSYSPNIASPGPLTITYENRLSRA